MTTARSDERQAAIKAVRAAAQVCQAVRRTMVSADSLEKKDRSPVTVADFASQAVVCAKLADTFADDEIIAEENADQLREPDQAFIRQAVVQRASAALPSSQQNESAVLELIDRGGHTTAARGGRYWTLDPIDGTKGFLRNEQYAVALALIEDGQVIMGVLGCPNLDHDGATGLMLAATRGEGTRLLSLDGQASDEGKPVHVSGVADPSAARFCESVESGHSSHGDAARIAQILGISAGPIRMDSQAKYATVARGEAQIYLRMPTRTDYREKIWDHAAGMIAVTEAGGRVSDVHGKPLDFTHGRQLETNQGIIATNGPIHDAVVEAVGNVLS